ncbi:MAG: glycosyltransferase [Bacteroidia bacterium]|nr:glycosyltransferase [Bacteroidia bacterium]
MIEVRKKILIAPLDWGLGHATRCIPIIRELQLKGCEVVIASSGDALILLKTEFPELKYFELTSYRATYSKYFPLILTIFFQLPKFLLIIQKEHKELEIIVKEQQIDLAISDNRYGCWTTMIPTVFLTHQVNIQMPFELKWLQGIINFFNHWQIRKFNYCWIPDFPSEGLTGKLTRHPNLKTKFIGILSRFKKVGPHDLQYDILAIISGPEHQRSVFESLVMKQLDNVPGKKLIVKGIPKLGCEITKSGSIDETNHLLSDKLNEVIESTEIIICRSGYSSIMDLAILQKKVVFIPTPGQTEQEYIAEELEKRGISYYQKQKDFNMVDAIEKSKKYAGFAGWNSDSNLLANAIDDLLLQHL